MPTEEQMHRSTKVQTWSAAGAVVVVGVLLLLSLLGR
jgi:hypothetical protein